MFDAGDKEKAGNRRTSIGAEKSLRARDSLTDECQNWLNGAVFL
jgi:hypothetical protein